MANGIFNIAKGSWAYLSSLPLGTDALELHLLVSAGLSADATMQDFATWQAVLTAGNTIATFTTYAPIVVTSGITIATDNTNNKKTMTITAPTWNTAGGALNNTLAKMIVTYRPTSGATATQKTPISYHDYVATTTGSNLVSTISTVLCNAT